jgi:hypothetical protein
MRALERRIERLLTAARDPAGGPHRCTPPLKSRRDPQDSSPPPRPAPLSTTDPLLDHLDGDLMFAYWENTLDDADREALEQHTLHCDRCCHWLLEVGRLFNTQVAAER